MSSTTTDSQESVIFLCEQRPVHVQVHPPNLNLRESPDVHVPETPPENLNSNQSAETAQQEQEDNDCYIVQETTGKYIS